MYASITNHKLVTVIRPRGEINASNAAAFQDQLTDTVASTSNSRVLVDMDQVESLDSSGLMALISGLSLAVRLGCEFSLCSVSPSIRIIFEISQLDRVFEIYGSPADARAAIA